MKAYERVYMREFALLLGECWLHANANLSRELGLDESPFVLEEYRDGAIYYWENSEGVQALIDAFLKQNEKGSAFFDAHIQEYQEAVQAVGDYKTKGRQELLNLARLYDRGLAGWIVMYYTGGDERSPKALEERAMKLRAKDTLGDSMDHLLRTTLPELYPDRPSCVAILRNEILEPPSEAVLHERLTHAVLFENSGQTQVLNVSRDDFKPIHPEFLLKEEVFSKDVREVKGSPACAGKVRGKVRVILRRAEMSDFQEGEILVTAMTTPDYVPAMIKSAAVVTDEGGVTCHAAIFSRELKKPCIIGTKIATQVLKDGDMVEVDANAGVVKIISPIQVTAAKPMQYFNS